MRNKKAKGLRRLAREFVIQTHRPLTEIDSWYKKMKSTYKTAKGEL